jgi:hypothetical protein
MTDSNARAALIELAVHYDDMAQANKHMAQQHEDILQVLKVKMATEFLHERPSEPEELVL